MTEETRVIKRYKSFILGFCKCGCGKETKIITSTWKKGLGHWLQTYKNGHNKQDYSKRKDPTREKHWKWKNGRRKAGKYILILRKGHKYCDLHGYVFEHRYRMELMIGRYLTEEEVIHHIDHNTRNNEESNLMLFANHGEHMTYERTKDMSKRRCKLCGSKKTKIKKRKEKRYQEWYGNDIDGFTCYKCYWKKMNAIKYQRRKKIKLLS